MKPSSERPGATVFYICLVAASCVALWEATRIRGLGQASGAATVPLIASGLMVLTTVIVLVRSIRRRSRILPALSDLRDLLPPRILGYMIFCSVFVAVIEVVGFWVASAGFLPLSFIALNRSGPVRAVLVTAGTLVLVYVVFVYLFRIYLP